MVLVLELGPVLNEHPCWKKHEWEFSLGRTFQVSLNRTLPKSLVLPQDVH